MNLTKENSTVSRLDYVDQIRGLAVVGMILVHTQIFFLSPHSYSAPFYKIVDFLGGTPGAAIFLFLMGYVFSRQEEVSWPELLKRALRFLFLGYLLNLLRYALPNYLWGLHHKPDYWEGVLMIDILQMVAPALILLMVLKRWSSVFLVLLLSLMIFLSSFFWGLTATPGPLDFLWGKGEWVFFPLFPWFAYCILGMLCWRLEKYFQNRLFFVGLILVILGSGLDHLDIWSGSPYSYYRSSPARLLWTMGVCLVWLVIAPKISWSLRLQKMLSYFSRHVTEFYFFSWLWITWLCFFFKYQGLNSIQVAAMFGMILVLTMGTVWLWLWVYRRLA